MRSAKLLAAVLVALSLPLTSPHGAGAAGFVNYELGGYPNAVPQVTTCPSSDPTTESTQCTNTAAEPAIRADNGGDFFASSENGLGGGTDAWRSSPSQNGQSYTYLGMPDGGTSQTSSNGFAPGGGDTDLAVAPDQNAAGCYNLYVASLSGANVDVSTSTDCGKTFTFNPIGATISGDDREWIAADVNNKVCLSYHDVATDHIVVDCSYAAGAPGTFLQTASAFDPSHQYLAYNNEIGNLQIDPGTHYIYQTFSGIGPEEASNPATLAKCTATGCPNHVVYMAVSRDGGNTFTDYTVYDSHTGQDFGHQFVNVSIDRAGNVYSVYCDNHNIYYSFSTNHGGSWQGPFQINTSPANTAIFPWSVAGNAGRLNIVYYGTSYYDPTTTPDNYPTSAAWYVYDAENDAALKQSNPRGSNSRGFTQVQASPVVHYGGVCQSGIGCVLGNRDLYDDFGNAVSPVTDALSIAYSDDQYDGSATNPPPSSNCTSAANNTVLCDHTNIATGQSALFQGGAQPYVSG